MKDNNQVAQMIQGVLPQITAVLFGTISAICDGMSYGWSAPIIPVLERPDSPIHVTPSQTLWLETIYLIGGLSGLPLTIYFVDKIGRHKTIMLAVLTNFTAWIMIATANSTEVLIGARFLTGLAGDVNFVAAPMYIAEIASERIRGYLSGIIYLMMLVGFILIYSIGPYVPLYASSIVAIVLTALQLVTFPFMPESPYYLLCKGETERARRSLQRLRGTQDVDTELAEINNGIQRQIQERGRPQDLFLVGSNRKATIIMTVVNAAQHLSGISVFLMNLHSILAAAGSIYIAPDKAGIIFSAVMLFGACIGSFIIDIYGRKILLVTSSVLTGISLLTLAIFFNLKKLDYEVDGISWIPIVCVMVYAAVFKIGLGMVPIVLTAELFPTKVKAMGMSWSDGMYLIFSLISIEIYQELKEYVGIEVPFYIFSASCILTALFAFFYVPETKGKTLEEIQHILKGEVPEVSKKGDLGTEMHKNGIDNHIFDEKSCTTHL